MVMYRRICLHVWRVAVSVLMVGTIPAAAEPDVATVLGYAEVAEAHLEGQTGAIRTLPALEAAFVPLALDERRSAGLGGAAPLRFDRGLARAARAHAIDMLERGFRGHVDPDGHSVAWRTGILARTYVGLLSENLAEQQGAAPGDPRAEPHLLAASMLKGFLDSPGHRRNLLDPGHTHHGVGAAALGKRIVLVHVLGEKRASLAEPPPLVVGWGEEVGLQFDQAPKLDQPVLWGIVPEAQAPGDTPPRPLSEPIVTVGPGDHRLRFFFPTDAPDTFRVIAGPIVVVRAATPAPDGGRPSAPN